jgi:hypothetical protein
LPEVAFEVIVPEVSAIVTGLTEYTIAVKGAEFTVAGKAHVAVEVMVQVITSPLLNIPEKVEPEPRFEPLTVHW